MPDGAYCALDQLQQAEQYDWRMILAWMMVTALCLLIHSLWDDYHHRPKGG